MIKGDGFCGFFFFFFLILFLVGDNKGGWVQKKREEDEECGPGEGVGSASDFCGVGPRVLLPWSCRLCLAG